MGIVGQALVAAVVVFGFHYGVKQLVATAVKSELGDPPPAPTITVDPETMRRALEIGRATDTSAQRASIDGASVQIEQMNRTIRPPTPVVSPSIPALPRH